MNPLEFIKAHPVGVAVAVFGIGAVFILARGSGGGGDSSGLQAFYAAQSAQAISGNQVQAVQIATQADVAKTLASTEAAVNINTLWANASTAMNTNNNQTALGLAPYALQTQIASSLGAIAAAQPAVTTTSQKNNNGFFGLGKSQSSTTTVTPNPVASQIVGQLSDWLHAMH